MRLDLLLCRLRFVRSRSRAQDLAQGGLIRCNGARVVRASHPVCAGDVLTLPGSAGPALVEILALPARRGPPAEARAHYRELDRTGESTIAGEPKPISERTPPP